MKSLFINLRAATRLLLFIAIVLIYFLNAIFWYVLTPDPIKRRKRLIENGSKYSQWILSAFNVHLDIINPVPQDEVSLVVGNHVGFIDIVCLQAVCPSVFITSLEMKHTPGLGQITDLGGCVYVNRRNRMNIQGELQNITDVLKHGLRVVLYPESVASNGEQVLPFKKTLLMSAGFSEKPIRPYVFNFREVNGGAVQYEQRDSLCWYGDQTFGPAVWRSLKLDKVVCEIEFLPLFQTSASDDRSEIAAKLHQMISEKYVPFKLGMNAVQTNMAGSRSRTELPT